MPVWIEKLAAGVVIESELDIRFEDLKYAGIVVVVDVEIDIAYFVVAAEVVVVVGVDIALICIILHLLVQIKPCPESGIAIIAIHILYLGFLETMAFLIPLFS